MTSNSTLEIRPSSFPWFATGNSPLPVSRGRMEHLIAFRETLLFYPDPKNGKRDMIRKNGSAGPGPLTIEARRELLRDLLKLQEEVGVKLITDDELFLIQQLWKSVRRPDDGRDVARIVTRQKGILGWTCAMGHEKLWMN